MKYFHCLVSLFLLLVSCHDKDDMHMQTLIDDVKHEFCNESRESLFQIDYRYEDNGAITLLGETTSKEAYNSLIHAASERNGVILDSINILPIDENNSWGMIQLSVANVRTRPAYSAEMASQVILGTPVKLLKKERSWYLIQSPEQYIGWVTSASVHSINANEFEAWKHADRIVFHDTYGEVLTNEGQQITDITAGSIVTRLSMDKSKTKVRLPSGDEGYIQTNSYITLDQMSDINRLNSDRLIEEAFQLKGRAYLWGGSSTKAMDCSGFVRLLYYLNGKIISRDASLQIEHGKAISPKDNYKDLQEGDLLFFGDHKRATHVGMYIGNMNYIHEAGKVKINSFNPEDPLYSEYRKNTLLGVRRYIGTTCDEGNVNVKDHPWYFDCK